MVAVAYRFFAISIGSGVMISGGGYSVSDGFTVVSVDLWWRQRVSDYECGGGQI